MNEEIELWRPINGCGGLYDVSNFGRIRSWVAGGPKPGVRSEVPRIRLQWTSREGYVCVTISNNKKRKSFLVHRLVAIAFLSFRDGREVNHKDGVKSNNKLSNLEWSTSHENMEHASKFGLLPAGERHGMARLTEIQVREILLKKGSSPSKLAKEYGVSRGAVRGILDGVNWVAPHSFKAAPIQT